MAWPPCLASGRSQSSKTKRPHRWLPIVFADTPGAMKALTRFNEDEELHGCKIGTASDVSARRILRLSVKIMKSNVECREPELFCGEVWACVRDAKKSRASDRLLQCLQICVKIAGRLTRLEGLHLQFNSKLCKATPAPC